MKAILIKLSFPSLISMVDACVGIQTVLCLEFFIAVFARVSWSFNMGFYMLLHIILEIVTIATCSTEKTSFNLALDQRFYLLFQFIIALAPSWNKMIRFK